jgi:hypothetical protein
MHSDLTQRRMAAARKRSLNGSDIDTRTEQGLHVSRKTARAQVYHIITLNDARGWRVNACGVVYDFQYLLLLFAV